MEACALREFAHRARICATSADPDNRIQMSLNRIEICRWIEGCNDRWLKKNTRFQKIQARTREHDSSVDALAAIDAWDHADHRVVIGVFTGHPWPPRRTPAVTEAWR